MSNLIPIFTYILTRGDKVYYTFSARGDIMAKDYAKQLVGEGWENRFVLFLKVGESKNK